MQFVFAPLQRPANRVSIARTAERQWLLDLLVRRLRLRIRRRDLLRLNGRPAFKQGRSSAWRRDRRVTVLAGRKRWRDFYLRQRAVPGFDGWTSAQPAMVGMASTATEMVTGPSRRMAGFFLQRTVPGVARRPWHQQHSGNGFNDNRRLLVVRL